MNSSSIGNSTAGRLQRWRRRLNARLAKPQALFLTADGVQVQGQAQPFPGWCQAHAGEAAELIVSARLLHELVCEPGLPLDDEAALQAYARQLFGHYFGAVAQRWPLAAWRTADQRGATALHGLDWAALQQGADDADVDLRRVRPAWAPLLQRLAVEEPAWLRPGTSSALAWAEGNLLSWVRLRDGQVQALRQLRLAEATQAALGDTLAELRASEQVDTVMALGYGLAGSSVSPVWPGVRVLGRLDAPEPDLDAFISADDTAARLPRPDFLGQRIRRSLLAWPLAATGALVLATAGWSAFGSHEQLEDAQLRVESLARMKTQGHAAARPVAAARPMSAIKPADLDRLRAASEVQALLQQAWEPLLANVEEAGASVPGGQLSWLSLDYSAGRNDLRLEGLTQDKLAALQLVDRLAAAPGWSKVILSRFQTGEQGLPGQRFELSARLMPDRLQAGLPAPAKGAAN